MFQGSSAILSCTIQFYSLVEGTMSYIITNGTLFCQQTKNRAVQITEDGFSTVTPPNNHI